MIRPALATTLALVYALAQLPPAQAQAQAPASTPAPAGSGSPTPAPSPTPTPNLEEEGPRDLQQRIDVFQDRRLIYEKTAETYSIRQGPDPLYDVDFVELLDDPSLTRYWLAQRAREWAFWLGSGAIGIPLGGALFLNNFQGQGPLAFFATGVSGDPSSVANKQTLANNVSDPRAFTLGLIGVGIAVYGAYNVGYWVLENLDMYHPNRLDEDSIAPRVRAFNEDLRERLNLEPSQLPAPPTPRPSPTPTVSTSPSPGTIQPQLPPGPIDQTMPEGLPPQALPLPLETQVPGVVPSALVPTPKPRPSVFLFPGPAGREAAPTPRPSASPSLVPYPGTEP